jgi:aryl-alcohol dehydrogenase-like predicted oxidoreductase
MQYGSIPGIEKKISRLVMGTMVINMKNYEFSRDLLDAAFALGWNTFDTAHVYAGGNSERALGAWINERGIRDKVVILDKCSHPNPDRNRVTPFDIAADLHDSLARLGTDYIDLYLLHRDDPSLPVGPIVEALNEHKEAGRINAFGGSNWTHERIAEANAYAKKHNLTPFAVSSPNYGLARQFKPPWADCISISGPEGANARKWYAENDVRLFAWSSLAGGFFSGRITSADFDNTMDTLSNTTLRSYCHEENFDRLDRVCELAKKKSVPIPQIALAYVLTDPLNPFPLAGPETPEQLQSCVDAFSIELSEQERAWLDLRE